MQAKHLYPDLGAPPRAANRPHSLARAGGPRRYSAEQGSNAPAAQVRRILVLAHRFQALCGLKSDPGRLVELLGSLIGCCRESFGAEVARGPVAAGRDFSDEQARCLDDLDALLHGLACGAPEASRGLGHAMDALLIQCVLLDAAGSRDAARFAPTGD